MRLNRRPWQTIASLMSAAAIAAILASHPAAADEERSQEYLEDAVRELEKGEANVALIHLRNAIQQDPSNLEARKLLGQLYLGMGDGLSAEKELRRVYDNAPSDEVELLLGTALLMNGRPEQVLDVVTETAIERKHYLQKLLLRADANMQLRRLDEAEALFREVLSISSDVAGAHFGLARLHAQRGDLAEADASVDATLELQPKSVDALLLRAEVAVQRGDAAKARKAVDEALALAPMDRRVLLADARLALKRGDVDAADRSIQTILDANPRDTLANYFRAIIQVARGEYGEANRTFTKVEDALRDFAPAMLLNGLIKFNLNQLAQAERSLSRYLAAVPENHGVRRLLATINLRLDSPGAAIDALQPLLAAVPDDAGALQLLASAQMRLGRYDEAMAAYERLSQVPNAGAARQARTAMTLLGVGGEGAAAPGREEADDELSRGVLLVLDYMRTRQFDEALQAIEELAEASPDNPVLLNLEGGVLLGKGEADEAREKWRQALELNPGFAAAQNNLYQLDLREGKLAVAEERLRSRLAASPEDERTILRLAEVLRRSDRMDEAVALLEEKQAMQPLSQPLARALMTVYGTMNERDKIAGIASRFAEDDAPESLRLAGEVFEQLDRPADAAEVYAKLARLQPDIAGPRLLQARALVAADARGEAREILEQVKAMEPANLAATQGLMGLAADAGRFEEAEAIADAYAEHDAVMSTRLKAGMRTRAGKPAEAVDLLQAAFEKTPNAALARDLFAARRQAGDTAAAVAGVRAWLEREPEDATSRQLLANALLAQEDYEAAAAEYETLLKAKPNDPVILNNLAWVADQLGRPDALELAQRAYQAVPGNAAIADTFGWMLVRRERNDEGLKVLQVAAAGAPQDADIQYHLAYALNQAGEKDDAVEILKPLVSADGAFLERAAAEALLQKLTD